ncbi:unnamed protein product, partial [Brassica oleracea var. botrytis]
ALQVWVYTALPELGANYGNPLPNNPSLQILAYKGLKGRSQFKEAILSQTRVINFVQKDIGEMFPKWELDVEDTPAENIIKLMFKKVVKEDSPRPQKKARKEAKDIKTMFKDIVDAMREGFGTCLKEIKYLSERVEAVEKKVGIITKRKGTSAQNTTPPPKPTLEPGSESVNGTNTGMKSLSEDKGPDVPADASSLKDKAPEPSLVLLDKNQSTVSDLQKEDARYMEKRDASLALCRAKIWGTVIDDVYAPVNYNDTHWIAMLISIPKRHIVVWDNICSSISPEDLDVVMEPFLYMIPYLLVECASSDEQRAQYNLEPFTYERPTNIPPARAGDCGVYTLNKKDFAKANGKTMMDKMAVDIFQELPDAHEFENKDNDANLGAYEG